MAKKIRLDFSKTEERSGWVTKQMPEGLHKMKIEAVQETEAGDGTDMLVYALVPTDPKYKARRFPFYCKLQANQLWKLRDLLVAAGQTVPKKAINIDPGVVVGKFVAAEIEDETGQYAGRSSVNAVYGLDILDEGEDAPVSDDEEEEYEGDEPEDEEYEDEEEEAEDEEEEEDEDLSTLSLADLRALAKELGIKTVGLKKDALIEAIEEAQAEGDEDDEDDLGEEDLEDDELEDEDFEDDEEEEEEPEPAPKPRRNTKAAAAKAPAKAAPAKRVIKRR